MRFVAVIVAALIALAVPASAGVYEDFKAGQAAQAAGHNKQAIEIFTTIITEDKLAPEWKPFSFFYRGQAYRKTKEFAKALADLEAAIALNPGLAPAHFEIGLVHHDQGRYRQAIKAYDEAVRLMPDNSTYIYSRCVSKSWLNDNSGAREDCRKAVELKPDFADAWAVLGRAYEDLGQKDLAINAYRHVLQLEPGNASAKEGLAALGAS